MPFAEQHALLRIGIRIQCFELLCIASGRLAEYFHSSLQRQIVGDAKEPAVEVVVGSTSLQMMKECEKRLLNNIFAILHGNAKANGISQQPCPHEIGQPEHFAFR